jgi:hypothetical protein
MRRFITGGILGSEIPYRKADNQRSPLRQIRARQRVAPVAAPPATPPTVLPDPAESPCLLDLPFGPPTVAMSPGMASGREEARVLLVPTTGAQRASRDPNRASHRGRSHRTRLALSVLLSASLLAAIGVASAEATTISPLSISSGATGTTVTTSTIYKPWYSVEVF